MGRRMWAALAVAVAIQTAGGARAQMVTGADMPGYAKTFGLSDAQKTKSFEVTQIDASTGPNILLPGESITLTFYVKNRTDQPFQASGKAELIQYGTTIPAGDIWTPHAFKIADCGATPVTVNLPAKGGATLKVTPKVPARFGGYALILDLGAQGRAFAATMARVIEPDGGRVWLPTYALDMPWPFQMSEKVTRTFRKLGVKACRMGASYTPTTSPNFERDLAELAQFLKWSQENNISVMLTIGAGSAPQPLGRGRPWLNPDNSMKQGVKEDLAWLPEYDADFQKWVKIVVSRYGWPKGPVNAVELWNEPWEGVSISGWGADMPRYRELYERMANGVFEARKEAGVKVLIGGASSSSNTLDKLFGDGSERFLPMLDFCSIHYQEMAAIPSLIPSWMHRKGAYGRVQVWDTESWVGNSEDRVAAVVASMRAQGQDRAMGIYGGNVYDPQNVEIEGRRYSYAQAYPPAAAVAAAAKFIGQRAYKTLLFKNGLPWVFVFGGGPKGADDGTVVVVGDLGGVYNRNKLLFRTVMGLKNAPKAAALEAKLAALPATATDAERKPLEDQLAAARVLAGASMTVQAPAGAALYDFYGNRAATKGGSITVPLNGLGYYLRTDGKKDSFAKLLKAIESARIEGIEPVEIVARDFTAPVEAKPALRLRLTNVLNRPVTGTLTASVEGLVLEGARRKVTLAPHQTQGIALRVSGGQAAPGNAYALVATFDGGKDGRVRHAETMHADVIARRSITVDGNLADWQGALPQTMSGTGIRANMTEKAWLPFAKFDAGESSGLATGYLAYDDANFYFAAKIADTTPYAGGVRFETRDDDAYFYPEVVTDRGKELRWPEGVRRFSYRKDPDLPSGNGADSVQIAFNVLPPAKKPWAMNPPGTEPRWMAYPDTDYEFAFNSVAPEYGGGTEIWKLFAPGVPRKHFYPRQGKAPVDGGPVKDGRLVMRRDGNTRIVETAIPWSQMPEVKRRIDAGQTVKFSFRVNDNEGPAYELAAGRSVSKDNFPAFHNDWATHWANELEFGVQR